MKPLIIILISFSFLSHSLAESSAVTKADMPEEYKTSKKYSSFNLELDLAGGATNNPVQLPSQDKVSANFYQLSPKISYDRELAKNLFLITNLSGDYKDFDEKVVSNIKSALKAQLDIGFSYFITPSHEVGVTGSGVYNKSSGLNFISSGLDTKRRDIEYTQGFYELYYSFNRPKYNVELSLNQVSNNNSGSVQDFAPDGSIGEFKDDFDQTGVKLKLNYKLSDDLSTFVEPSYSKRKYKERAAKFSEGASGQIVNPKLSEVHRGLSVGLKYDDDFVKSEVKGLFVKEKDLQFRANNANSYGIEGKLSLPIAGLFELGGEYSLTKRNYEFFVSNPEQAPTTSDLRKDVDQSYGVSVSKQFNKINLKLKYNALNKDSNYKPFGSTIGSQYNEQIISLGLNIKL